MAEKSLAACRGTYIILLVTVSATAALLLPEPPNSLDPPVSAQNRRRKKGLRCSLVVGGAGWRRGRSVEGVLFLSSPARTSEMVMGGAEGTERTGVRRRCMEGLVTGLALGRRLSVSDMMMVM
jgi:hypothetical protein